MNNILLNVLLTKDRSRVNNVFNHNYKIHKESYYDKLIKNFNENERFQSNFYKNFCLDIVTETVFDYPQAYFSEKLFRSIAEKKIFIYVGPCHSLKFLKEFGFKTFHSYISEEYDNERNPSKRMSMIENEIETFVKKPTEEIKNILINATDILEHNFSVLQSLYNKELDRVIKQLESQHV